MEGKARGDCHCPAGAFNLEQRMNVSTLIHYCGPGAIIGIGIASCGNPDMGKRT